MKFRKKPIVIEAVQWNGGNHSSISGFLGDCPFWLDAPNLHLETLEGMMIASPGDWIIKGVKGEFYPCKPDVFEQTYERADGVTTTWL